MALQYRATFNQTAISGLAGSGIHYILDPNTGGGAGSPTSIAATYDLVGNCVYLSGSVTPVPVSSLAADPYFYLFGNQSVHRTGGSNIGELRLGSVSNDAIAHLTFGTSYPSWTVHAPTVPGTLGTYGLPSFSAGAFVTNDLSCLATQLTVDLTITNPVNDVSLLASVYDALEISGSYFIFQITSTTGGSPSTSPAHGPLTGGTSLTITGEGVGNTSAAVYAVTIGGVAATDVVAVNDTTVTCTSPAFGGSAGLKDVVVISSYGGGTITKTLVGGFLYDTSSSWCYNPALDTYQYIEGCSPPNILQDPDLVPASSVPLSGSTLGGD